MLVVVGHDRHGRALAELEVELLLGVTEILAADESTGAGVSHELGGRREVEGSFQHRLQVHADLHALLGGDDGQYLVEISHLHQQLGGGGDSLRKTGDDAPDAVLGALLHVALHLLTGGREGGNVVEQEQTVLALDGAEGIFGAVVLGRA